MKHNGLVIAATLVLAALAAACSGEGKNGSASEYFDIDNGNVLAHATGAPDAVVTPNGELHIAGASIAANAAQQELLKHLHASVLSLRDHAIATGKAGAATGMQALSSVVSGLASGNPDKIDQEVNAKAAKIEAEVTLLCADLAEIRRTQESLSSQLPAFKPYATIDAKTVANCKAK